MGRRSVVLAIVLGLAACDGDEQTPPAPGKKSADVEVSIVGPAFRHRELHLLDLVPAAAEAVQNRRPRAPVTVVRHEGLDVDRRAFERAGRIAHRALLVEVQRADRAREHVTYSFCVDE